MMHAAADASTAWEYQVVHYGSIWGGPKPEVLEQELNLAAEEGWELFSLIALTNTSKLQATFRRPLVQRRRPRSSSWP